MALLRSSSRLLKNQGSTGYMLGVGPHFGKPWPMHNYGNKLYVSRDYNYPLSFPKMGMYIREFAEYFDRIGCRMQGEYAYLEQLNRHRRVNHWRGILPVIGDDVFIAPNASVIGEVTLEHHAAVWYNAVVRGDDNAITIGANTQIAERCVIRGGHKYETRIGASVNIEPGCVIMGAMIGDGARVGAGSTIQENTLIGENSQLGPGSVVTRDTEIGAGEYWEGLPAKFVRTLTAEELELNSKIAEQQQDLSDDHREECNKPYEQVITERDVKTFYKVLDCERTYIWAK
eukprot:NODE_2862_length_1025_cov_13.098361_g2398_i0.p1 GENE.NODE_2862_length_1025_cov_13.098361_g2398_i0~~NODE_2862_length_1025_cov_13.098361_g2398_i0.p1  ORF type:complete len:287 (+),score=64.59 NODE_2862_length_1025_cov_13.098361_g2398_i0:86-946(+)